MCPGNELAEVRQIGCLCSHSSDYVTYRIPRYVSRRRRGRIFGPVNETRTLARCRNPSQHNSSLCRCFVRFTVLRFLFSQADWSLWMMTSERWSQGGDSLRHAPAFPCQRVPRLPRSLTAPPARRAGRQLATREADLSPRPVRAASGGLGEGMHS